MNASSNKVCRHCQDIDTLMGTKIASRELRKYQNKGPGKTAKLLLNYLKTEDIQGSTLLDIGGGVGVLQHEMLKAGISQAIHVDASSTYLQASREEAERQGHADRIIQFHGDFVDLAPTVPKADIVTHKDVICCYPDVERLVTVSAKHAQRFYGIVYPKSNWWLRQVTRILNIYFWVRRKDFRYYSHSRETVHAILDANDFERCFDYSYWLDLIEVYKKREPRAEN